MRALATIGTWGAGAWAAGTLFGPSWTPAGDAPPAGTLELAGDDRAVLPWASVTKLCSALAVLVAVEEGTVALAEPAGPAGSTVAHLLSHASGLGPGTPVPLAPPGARRIYSNAGFEMLADHVAVRSGIPFADYVDEAVCRPLGMTGTRWRPGRSPAHGLTGTARDLMALGAELRAPTLVHPSTLDRATRVAFPGLAGVLPGFGRHDPCDWGLGFELRDGKHPHWTGSGNSPRTFGHFGRSGCFLWVDPDRGVVLGVLTDRPFGPWAAAAWPVLSDAVLAEVAA